MRHTLILSFLGWMIAALCVLMLFPIFTAIIFDTPRHAILFISALAVCVFAAGLMIFTGRHKGISLRRSDLCILVFLGWAIAGVFTSLPFWMILDLSFAKAYFLAISALTTTGALIFPDITVINSSIKLWLALLQWIGGGATILMAMMILAPLGIGGMGLRQIAGVYNENENQQVQGLLRALKIIAPAYCAFTVICFLFLLFGGVGVFDALLLAFSTISTGGMNLTSEEWILGSPYVKFILAVFMLLGAMNIAQYYLYLHGRYRLREDLERKVFLAVIIITGLILSALLIEESVVGDQEVSGAFAGGWGAALLDERWRDALGNGMFSAISVMSTTNFRSPDLELPFIFTLLLTFVGGMTVSTAGGIKIMRILLLLRQGSKELSVLAYPHDVKTVSFEGATINIDLMQTVWVFFALFNASIAALMLIFSLTGLSFEHSLAASIAAISNAGPMIDMVGIDSTKLYANLPNSASWAMSLGMIGGRIELLALLSILSPIYWKR